MKKIRMLIMILIMIGIIAMGKTVYGANDSESENQKLVYQDVTINRDGSITVKEAMWLNGEYNGAKRTIEIKNPQAYAFTGIYSNFSGDTDIYNATRVSNIKVFDISQSNFKSIQDINHVETEFKRVEKASKGKYGVYTLTSSNNLSRLTMYCPSKKQKVFYIEYTIKDAIVVHNDVAELYWCLLENETTEDILDYQAVLHLPQEDSNVMVWSHGPSTGSCKIVDNKTVSLTDRNIEPYDSETIRIMFDTSLVPQANKKSNVNGKEHILQYEKAMSDPKTARKETNKITIENQLGDKLVELKQEPSIFCYNRADRLIERITWDDNLKQEYRKQLDDMKENVNQNWKESIERKYYILVEKDNVKQTQIDDFRESIEEGFDEDVKVQYLAKADQLQKQLDEKNQKIKQKLLQIVIIVYYLVGAVCLFVLLKNFWERRRYYQKYYRDFPNEDNAYIIDYLMHKKITSRTFSVTILDLIAKKRIRLETNHSMEGDYNFVLQEGDFTNSRVENIVIQILFNVAGSDNKCSLSTLKKYGKTSSESSRINSYFQKFEKSILKEVERKEYFKKNNSSSLFKKLPIIIASVAFALGFFIYDEGKTNAFSYYFVITLLGIVYYKIVSLDKGRTKKGGLAYSKWLAHKRFLKDFGRFDSKELPEIILWEKYFVTAMALGCSDKVLQQMKVNLNLYDNTEQMQEMIYFYKDYETMRQLDSNIHSMMHKSKIDARNSSYSSGGSSSSSGSGFGGGSSGGGSGGGGGGWSRF